MKNSTNSFPPQIANWSEQKSKLKAKFPVLNYSDLQYEEDQNAEMLNHVQIKLGKTREEFAAIIGEISSSSPLFE